MSHDDTDFYAWTQAQAGPTGGKLRQDLIGAYKAQ
jgi:hypothetical protein